MSWRRSSTRRAGQVDLFQVCIVANNPGVRGRDIAKADADRQVCAEIGDELLFQIFLCRLGCRACV